VQYFIYINSLMRTFCVGEMFHYIWSKFLFTSECDLNTFQKKGMDTL